MIQVCVIEVALERAGVRPSAGSTIPDRDVKRALCDMLYRYLHPAAVLGQPCEAAAPPAPPGRRAKVK